MRKYGTAKWMLGFGLVWAIGCAKPVAPEEVGGDGPNGSNGSNDSSNDDDPSNGGTPGGGRGGGDPTDDLPGAADTFDVAPEGCVGGFSAGALSLRLSDEVSSVRLEASDSNKLVANGTVCTSGSAELALADISALEISGGAADNAVILDLGNGDWSSLLGEESIELTLGQGNNTLLVRGTAEADHFRHGMRQSELVLDLLGNGDVSLAATGLRSLGVSLGGGDDRLDDLAAFLAESDEASETPIAANPMIEGNSSVTALSVALVAYGADGNDFIVGGSGDDELDGGPGTDVISGLAGNDLFLAAADSDGDDTLNGGPGYDEVTYELRTNDLVLVSCSSPASLGCEAGECDCNDMSGETNENDRLVNMEDFSAGAGNDILRGSDGADALSGGAGDDSLFGNGGADLLYGQRGNDVLEGGLDGDYCDGASSEHVLECEL